MDFQQLIDAITPDIYDNLKRAVETGKWPDGSRLTKEQREHSMQAIIAYDARHKSEEERVGYVAPKQKAEPCATKQKKGSDPQPLKWQE
ncbi:YeaC family protein [Porticoccus litoralis]|uniref:DUF1315 family protein n=1 Tax=Porticoccus litoralis TaxID=434086 RepID=A0AAW8B459_9GAMM|nr:DUF1315 family protein [Porticoccus litoralis]MDP1521235.1 DUF1315 family protein [Porticoccus litoralis]TNE94164.1 MAG: DUF1315 family protein [Gammaproteobacteria bacterium]